MSRNQKAWALLVAGLVGQVVAGKIVRQQAAALAIPAVVLSGAALAIGAFLA